MAWGWRPVMHSIHLFLLTGTISMVTCWWLWLHNTAYAVSPPSPILWLICVFYMLLAIIVFPAAINTMQLLRISKLTASLIVRAIILFTVSIFLATLIAAAALEPPIVSATASLAGLAILNFFLSTICISSFSMVPVVDIVHRRILPDDQEVVDVPTFVIPVLSLLGAIIVTVNAVQLATASHPVVAHQFDPFQITGCAVLAFCCVIVSIFIAGHLPLPQQS